MTNSLFILAPRSTIERKSANDHPPKISVRASRAFKISRKSILVKDVSIHIHINNKVWNS